MNSKIDSQLRVINKPKKTNKKLSKQLEQNRITEMEITWRLSVGEWEAERGGKGTENK